MQQRVRELAARPRFNALILAAFAVTGLMLAAIGLYGVISFLVTQRTQEIGVRLALGATSANILKLVFSTAMNWTFVGIALGIVGSLSVTRVLRSLLFNVAERDIWTLSGAVVVILVVAGIAAWMPAMRASRTDPVAALRQ